MTAPVKQAVLRVRVDAGEPQRFSRALRHTRKRDSSRASTTRPARSETR